MSDDNSILISMDGKSRWADNIWVERIWKTIKYECVYMLGVESLIELKSQLNEYLNYYNNYRLHSSLGYKTPTFYYDQSIKFNSNNSFEVYCEYAPISENEMVA